MKNKIHNSILEINLDALAHNLNIYRDRLNANTLLLVMVKAFAYGGGSIEISKLLESQQVDYLAVAYEKEGIELRKAGVQLPILVLNPSQNNFELMARYQLEPSISNLTLLQKLIQQTPTNNKTTIHLKLDTGMHRLGFEQDDLKELTRNLTLYPQIKIKSIFSHLAASEESNHDNFTEQQVKLFLEMYQYISTTLKQKPLRHILSSSGIIRFPQYQFDMVRLGIGFYGYENSHSISDQIKNVHTFKTTISQIKTVAPMHTVGYNRKAKILKKSRIATISLGYADGLLRRAGNNRYQILVRGKLAPIIGHICMDMSMIDVSDIPNVKEGDEVIIFGDDLPITVLAKCLDTIPYEIFTGISSRVKRVYTNDDLKENKL